VGQNKQLSINIIAQTINFAVNVGINLLLTPFIIKNVGSESYGFVGLANSFVIYAELITIALNSMAGRFIIIKIYQDDRENTNRYFTSVFYANLITAMALIIPAFFIVIKLNKIVNITSNITDIKLLWMFIFANFITNIVFTTFGLATYAKNRFDLSSLLGITSSLIRVIVLTIAYHFFPANVWYIGFSAIFCTFYSLSLNLYFTKRLLPEVRIQKKYFDFAVIKEIISSGIWNALTKLSQIFTSGVDLLITNIFIGSKDMGALALAKTIPNFIINFVITISNVFNPQITKQYAKNNEVDLVHSIKNAMKLITVISTIPNAILLVFGAEFYRLWVPGEDAVKLQIISFLTVANLCITGPLQPVYQIFTITNKVKKNSIIMIIYGIVSVVLTILLLKTTNLGIYSVVGVSILLSFIVSLVFHIPYGSICLGLNWKTFYPEIGKSLVSFLMLSFFYFVIKHILPTKSWPNLLFSFFICGCIGLLCNIFLLLNKRERKVLANQVLKKFLGEKKHEKKSTYYE
jgi:O-antigen/teichoic acid export membrane protein